MHRIAYIAPPLTALGLVLWLGITPDWWAYLVMVAVAELVLWLVLRRMSRKREYLSGYAHSVEHHNPWVERVVTTETYTDSRGRTHTRQRVHYVRHSDEWWMWLNTGESIAIAPTIYNLWRTHWATPCEHIDPYHPNCVSGGGGQRYAWNCVYEDAATVTYKGLYINYLANSNSIFLEERITKERAEEMGLVDYPDFGSDGLDTPTVLCSSHLPEEVVFPAEWQRTLQLINAFYGAARQIHLFVVLFAARDGIEAARAQRNYWQGGNKNELTICLGVDCTKGEAGGYAMEVRWCDAFSWCDAPRLDVAIERWFVDHSTLDLTAFGEWLRANLSLWQRKSFSDFKYLGIRLSTGHKWLLFALTLLLCGAMVAIALECLVPYTPPA